MRRKMGLAFHYHHDTLYDYAHNYDERVQEIKAYKSNKEQPLRLALFQLVPEELIPGKDSDEWKSCNKAREAYDKAGEAYDKVREAHDKAREAHDTAEEAYDKAWEAHYKAREAHYKAWEAYDTLWGKEIIELHTKLCPNCPWDGKTIFTRKNDKGEWY